MELVEQLRAEYSKRLEEIKWAEDLSDTGKREAQKELTSHYLMQFQRLEEDNKKTVARLQEEKAGWERTAPPAPDLTEQELLAEQRAVNLLISKLIGGGTQDFLRMAEDAATKHPGVFLLAYPKVLDVAEKHYPGPATLNYIPDGETPDPVNPERPFIFSQLQGFYDRALDATTTPEEKVHREKIDELDSQIVKGFMKGFHLDKTIERLKQELAPTFEEISSHYIK